MRKSIALTLLSIGVVIGFWTYASPAKVSTSPTAKIAELNVYVYGAVTSPACYRWFAGMTVVDAIRAAGGFTNSPADRIWISHQDSPDTRVSYKWETAKTPPTLKAGDFVDVPADLPVSHGKTTNPEPVR